MTHTSTITTPCRADPAGWDIPDDPGYLQIATVTAAVFGCDTCPLIDACAAAAADDPPRHNCVQARRVYWRNRVYTLQGFIRLRQQPTRAAA